MAALGHKYRNRHHWYGFPYAPPRDQVLTLGVRDRHNTLKVRDMVLLQAQKEKLMAKIEQNASLGIRAGLYADLRRVSEALGVDVPDLSTFKMPDVQSFHQPDD